MSPELSEALNAGYCPDCRAPLTVFLGGPTGGISRNMCCSKCWSAFNAALYGGVFVFAERIGNDFWRGVPGFKEHGTA
jgi:hypothetical protein